MLSSKFASLSFHLFQREWRGTLAQTISDSGVQVPSEHLIFYGQTEKGTGQN